jgi:hypothetical protein
VRRWRIAGAPKQAVSMRQVADAWSIPQEEAIS